MSEINTKKTQLTNLDAAKGNVAKGNGAEKPNAKGTDENKAQKSPDVIEEETRKEETRKAAASALKAPKTTKPKPKTSETEPDDVDKKLKDVGESLAKVYPELAKLFPEFAPPEGAFDILDFIGKEGFPEGLEKLEQIMREIPKHANVNDVVLVNNLSEFLKAIAKEGKIPEDQIIKDETAEKAAKPKDANGTVILEKDSGKHFCLSIDEQNNAPASSTNGQENRIAA